MLSITDIRVEKILKISDDYLCNIDSIRETFETNYLFLHANLENKRQSFSKFLNENNIKGISDITSKHVKVIRTFITQIKRCEVATKIFPQSMLVSLVSQYDYLIGLLIQYIYEINPQLLKDSNSQITYKDLFQFNNLDEIKDKIIKDKIETVLRKSHEEQLIELQKIVGIETLKPKSLWKDFVEITQRRNLLVHSKGCVSEQYIRSCQNAGVLINVSKGDFLDVDYKYFERAYFVFYSLGVMLTQVISRHLLKEENLLGSIDTILNQIIYNTIEEEKYDLSIELSTFATNRNTKHSCRLDEVFFILNYAQAYKWNGDLKKCEEVLSTFDFSAVTPDILIAKYTLEDNIEKVVENMLKIGSGGEIMTKEAYVTWPIFKDMRQIPRFIETYKYIFNEDLPNDLLTENENDIVNEYR